jgi:3-oxoadipate enol-lactonase
MRFERIKIAGIGTRYGVDDRAAEAPWLLLIHCLGGSLELWKSQLPLATSFRLVAYDLRGQGESDVPQSAYAIADLADDALSLLDELSIEPVSVVGLSMGGLVAQTLASRNPDRVEKLVLAHSTAYFPLAAADSLEERATRAEHGGMAQIAVEAMHRTLTEPFRKGNPVETARVRSIFESTDGSGFALACRAMAGFDGRASLTEIRAPTLVIGGDSDPNSTPELVRTLAGGIADSRLVFLPAAHLSNVERPDTFNRLVRAFVLNGITP